MMHVIRWFLTLYPIAKLLSLLGLGPPPVRYQDIDEKNEPRVNPNPCWKVTHKQRLSACDNRPGLKKLYVTVLDAKGIPLGGIKVRFDVEPSQGTAYDHPNVWGMTNEQGYLEWNHLGIPTRYLLWMEGDETPLIENIRTDFGYEYCKIAGAPSYLGNRPVNRPGVYSYRIEIQRRGDEEQFQRPVISNLAVEALDDDLEAGYARLVVSFDTDIVTEAEAYYSLFGGSSGGDQPVCDPFAMGWHSRVSTPAALHHEVEVTGDALWYNRSASKKRYCLQVVAWPLQYPHWDEGKGYSKVVSFTLPKES